jgi:1-acyl-sn-glycerol-3-phosphate acyltransferase
VIYALLILTVRAFNLVTGHKTIRHGTGRLPRNGGAVLAINHTSYVDFTYIGVNAKLVDKRQLRFMGKIELTKNPVLRWLMWGCRVIAVDRSQGHDSYLAAVKELRNGEIVAIYPEATISRSFEIKDLKNGAARMALEAGVPIIPGVVWGSQRIATKGQPRHLGRTRTPVLVTVGEPIPPTGSADELTGALHTAMEALLDEAQVAYGLHPLGESWVPARLGGSAPTPAEVDEQDEAVNDS